MESRTTVVANEVARDLGSWKTIALKVVDKFVNHTLGDKVEFDTVVENYIETRQGKRSSDRVYKKGQAFNHREGLYCDGSRAGRLQYWRGSEDKQIALIITRGFGLEERSDRVDRPVPLLYNYVGREPLQEAIPKGTPLADAKVGDWDCDVFLFTGVNWNGPQDHIFFISKNEHTPVQFCVYANRTGREKDTPLLVWTAEKVEKFQGHSIATESRLIAYDQDGKTPTNTRHYSVESVKFDEVYPATTFWPEVGQGVSVTDTITKKSFTTPRAKEADAKATPTSTVVPIATPPRDLTPVLSWSTVGLGIAVVVTAIVIRIRRG